MVGHLQELFSKILPYLSLSFVLCPKSHLDQNHPNPICEHCNQKFDSMSSLNQHHLSECTKITVNCALQQYGCDGQVVNSYLINLCTLKLLFLRLFVSTWQSII